jgi:flagellar biosynthesis protein
MSEDEDYRAVALFYDGDNAPQITAAGSGEIGRVIAEIAAQHGIPMMQSEGLTELLAAFEVGDRIPENLYITIAEVIAFAWMLSGKMPEGFDQLGDQM